MPIITGVCRSAHAPARLLASTSRQPGAVLRACRLPSTVYCLPAFLPCGWLGGFCCAPPPIWQLTTVASWWSATNTRLRERVANAQDLKLRPALALDDSTLRKVPRSTSACRRFDGCQRCFAVGHVRLAGILVSRSQRAVDPKCIEVRGDDLEHIGSRRCSSSDAWKYSLSSPRPACAAMLSALREGRVALRCG